MTYGDVRSIAKNGDVLLVEGSGFISKFIRVFTGQSISHVGMFVWLKNGLFIAEFVEGTGYQIKPASEQILTYEGILYFGKAPEPISINQDCVKSEVLAFRSDKSKQKYGYLSLLKVWWAQLWHAQYEVREKVCSTFVQHVWNKCGYNFKQLADPGDFIGLCQYTSRII